MLRSGRSAGYSASTTAPLPASVALRVGYVKWDRVLGGARAFAGRDARSGARVPVGVAIPVASLYEALEP
ncbi:MAG: hypothetical protein JO188_09410 [Hyphomicrobiales bacterium]|nr:hypothetical protein [Hyphomicrobiales bacterium]